MAGQTGTVTVVFRGRLYADGNTTGTVELKDGRGGLAGLHGRGTFQGNFLLPLPYTLQYSFGS